MTPKQERLLEAGSILAAISFGPVFLFLGYKAGLIYNLAAYAFFLVCLTVIPVLSACGGRLAFLVWQLAALSVALSVVVDDSLRGREALEVGFGMWAFATILSSPLPIWLLVQKFKERKQRKKAA